MALHASAPGGAAGRRVRRHARRRGLGRLSIRPPRAGPVDVVLDALELPAGATPLAVTLRLEKPSFGLGPFEAALVPAASGAFAPAVLYLPMDGLWIVRLEILVDEFRKIELTDIVSIDS